MGILATIPIWYAIVAGVWAFYQGVRGVYEHWLATNRPPPGTTPATVSWNGWARFFVMYLHDFAFRFVCTAAGFLALYVSHALLRSVPLSAGSGTLIGLLFLVGVVGVGGQLHYVILLGKVPK